MICFELSDEPSLKIKNSKSVNVCFNILSIADATYLSALYTGIITEISGMVLNNCFRGKYRVGISYSGLLWVILLQIKLLVQTYCCSTPLNTGIVAWPC